MKKRLFTLALIVALAACPPALASDDRDPAAAARKALMAKGITCESLAREYEAILRAREALHEKYAHIETAEEAKAYVREAAALRERTRDYEAERCAFEAAYPIIPEPPKPLSP